MVTVAQDFVNSHSCQTAKQQILKFMKLAGDSIIINNCHPCHVEMKIKVNEQQQNWRNNVITNKNRQIWLKLNLGIIIFILYAISSIKDPGWV